MIDAVLCADIGTTSLKAGLITCNGGVVSFSSQKLSSSQHPPLYTALSWKEALRKAIGSMKNKCDFEQVCIKAISISGNGPTLVLENGLTYKWNEKIDTSIFNTFNENAKSYIYKSLFLPRILMLRHLYKKEFSEFSVFSGPEYLIYELTNNKVTVLPEERYKEVYWTSEALKACNILEDKMPPFVKIGDVCGYLTKQAAEFLELEQNIPVVSGGPDFIAALIGTNTLSEGKICNRCGSSEGFNYCVSKKIFSNNIRTLPSVIPGLWNCSYLIPLSSTFSKSERILKARTAVSSLKNISKKYDMAFENEIVVTGGQIYDKNLMKRKAKALKMPLSICQLSSAELLGDCCAAFVALKKYETLQEAASKIVKKEVMYESI